ncbi:MAG: hypothetical protein EOL93_13510 [Epsilonproteobacteria bacterium]|nr:hypothetical protein [Campylobacterota bacterium]
MKKAGYILFFLCLLCGAESRAQKKAAAGNPKSGLYQAIMNLDFPAARGYLSSIDLVNTEAGIVGETQFLWWYAISEGESLHPLLLLIDSLTTLLPTPEDPLLSTHFSMVKMRLFALESNYIKAWKAWAAVEKNLPALLQQKNDSLIYLIEGMCRCIKGELQQKIPLLMRDSVTHSVNTAKGIHLLRLCTTNQNPVIRGEANYYLMRYYADITINPLEALTYSTYLITTYPQNYIFRYYHIQILLAIDQRPEALKMAIEGKQLIRKSNLNPEQKAYGIKLITRACSLSGG